ncbi:MAG: hypothetical protein PHT07_10660 [Paludibacter sp.]|nr:hypothetical protein [Paludibacter sp.]
MEATEGKILASTGLLFGTIAILLFLLPFFLYSKNRDEIRQEGPIKVIGEVLFFHVLLMVVLVIFTSAINTIVLKPEFSPEQGIKYFFGNSNSTAMWDYWLSKSVTSTTSSLNTIESDVMSSFIAVMKYYSLFVFIICVAIPIAVLWQTVGNITAVAHEGTPHYQDFFASMQTSFLTYFGMTAIVVVHCSIASIYVALYIDGFSFYTLINRAWHILLFG